MADKIKINTARLGTDAERVNNYITKIEQEITNMKESVSQLDRMWDGPSREAFKKAFADDMNAIASLVNSLKSIWTYGTNAKTEYEKCEQKVSSLISEIQV